jgi:Fe-S-cluster containining protein
MDRNKFRELEECYFSIPLFTYLQNMEPREFRNTLESYFKVIFYFSEQKNRFDFLASAREKVADLLKSFKESDAENGKKITCRKSCSHCCYIHASAGDSEVKDLVASIKSGEVKISENLLNFQSTLYQSQYEATPIEKRRCIFLQEDNSCGVYERRPLSCRIHHSLSPPEKCDTLNNQGEQIFVWSPLTLQIVVSAFLSVDLETKVEDELSLGGKVYRELNKS